MDEREEANQEVINRLRTIRGHIGGIEKMVEEGKDCQEILVQMAAIRSSLEKVTQTILEKYARECIYSSIQEGNAKDKVNSLVSALLKFTK